MSFRFLSYRPVGEDEDAVRTDLLRVHEPQIPRFPHVPEEVDKLKRQPGKDILSSAARSW